MRTYQPKEGEVKRSWHLIDAKEQVLGRMATRIARLLTGKDKVSYSQHMDSGDYVVIINAEKVRLTGRKEEQKVYYKHSGYLGNLKTIKYSKMIAENPEEVVRHAVSGMLPDNRLKDKRLARLKIVKGSENPYSKKLRVKEQESIRV